MSEDIGALELLPADGDEFDGRGPREYCATMRRGGLETGQRYCPTTSYTTEVVGSL